MSKVQLKMRSRLRHEGGREVERGGGVWMLSILNDACALVK